MTAMRLSIFFIGLVFSQHALTQEARNVECRFLLFPPGEELDSVIARAPESEDVSCPVSSSDFSAPLSLPVINNRIAFFSTDGKTPLATAIVPSTATSAIVILLKSPVAAAQAAPTWKALVIDDNKKNFPKGGAYVCNLFSGDIRFVIGEHRGILKPGGIHGYQMPEKRDDFNMAPVIVQFFLEDKWIIANESGLRFLPQIRYLIFAFVDPASGRPRIMTFRDLKVLE